MKKIFKYECTICGYIYDPENGDSTSNIKKGTPFEELSDGSVLAKFKLIRIPAKTKKPTRKLKDSANE